MTENSKKNMDALRAKFMDSFLRIVECPYRNECKLNFMNLDTSAPPQGGFIGRNYWKNRILIIGQNPGGGKSPKAKLRDEDDYYYGLVNEFRQERTMQTFSALMEYMENDFMPKWPLFRNFGLERHWGFGISDIALINAVHCRTKNDITPNRQIAKRCFREHTSEQISILTPRLIICFGKKAYDFLNNLYSDPMPPIKYVLHPSGQYTRQHPDKQMKLIDEISRFLNGGKTKPNHMISPKKQSKKRILDSEKSNFKKGRDIVISKAPNIAREQLRKYLVDIGFRETNTESFSWSGKHSVLGTINFIEKGNRFGFNLLSTDMRNHCGYSTAHRKKLPNEERETIYQKYLKTKPYYEDIKHGLKFHYRASATDYVSLSSGIDFEKFKSIIEYERKAQGHK